MTDAKMTKTEARCWEYLVKHRDANAEELALNCDVSEKYAGAIIARIGTPPIVAEDPARVRILKQGVDLTSGDRNVAYGDPLISMRDTAAMWTAFIKTKYGMGVGLTAEDAAHMMQLLKITRTYRGVYREDNYVDNATYGAMAGECRLRREEPW